MGNQLLQSTCYSQKQLESVSMERSQSEVIQQYKKTKQALPAPKINQQGLPLLSQQIADLLSVKRPFHRQFENITNPSIIRFKSLMYFGETNKEKSTPNGVGKLYFENGSLLISHFQQGKPVRQFFFVKADGSYSQGTIKEGQIITECNYHQKDFEFNGSVHKNCFEGLGVLHQKNYTLSGNFASGTLKSGKVTWCQNQEEYIYVGQFNQQMEMHGLGMIIEPTGIYEGKFMNNKKQGQGKYKYKNYNTYAGFYSNNYKSGFGVLKSRYGKVIYEGQWQKGFPKNQQNTNLDKILSQKSLREIKLPILSAKSSSNTSTESQNRKHIK